MSDIHLAPLPPINPREMSSKRLVGYNSWQFRRKAIHRPEVASALVQDVKKVGCDHIMVSGDLVNLALPREFINGASWLRNLGKPENVSFVPGNHDAYVKTSWETGLGLLGDFMTGDLLVKGAQATPSVAMPFPYVRQRRNIALIGLTTAVPSRPGRAIGELGTHQIETLAKFLRDLRQRGFYRLVMIHHPPLPNLTKAHKALMDAADLRAVLEEEGCNLVVHGHNHVTMRNELSSRHGMVHIIGLPSGTSCGARNTEPAAWNQYEINRSAGKWTNLVKTRSWDADKKLFVPQTSYSLEQ
ncbi:MAG: metallophosphoesterase [Anderseniella sp.]